MTSNAPDLPHIPAQRYFTLNELCALVEISPEQFAQWQHAHGVVVGYGGDHYTPTGCDEITPSERHVCAFCG